MNRWLALIDLLGKQPCVVCHRPSSPEPFYYLWRAKRYTIYRCPFCTHQFVFPPVTADEQTLIYGDQYFASGGDWMVGLHEGKAYADAEPYLRQEAQSILALLPAPPGRLLDIGCAGGVFLDEARAAGFEVAGVELNQSMAQSARTRFGLEVHATRFEAFAGTAQFDVVTLLDCLEHIPNPRAALETVARLLRSGGTVLIRGPLSNSRFGHFKEWLRRRMLWEKQLPGYPLDANTFTPGSMEALLRATGFEIDRWDPLRPEFGNLLGRRDR